MTQDTASHTASAQAAWLLHAAVPAIIAGYALQEVVRTSRLLTAAHDPASGASAFNRFAHSRQRWTHAHRTIVTPANDLLYGTAWLDLRAGPVVLHTPAHTGRYFVLGLLDAYTNNFANIGVRNTPSAGGRVALVGPGHDPAEVSDAKAIASPTNLVWIIGRVLVDSDADLADAIRFQDGFSIDAPAVDQPFASVTEWQDGGEPVVDFLANLGRALRDFPPPPSQAGVFAVLRSALAIHGNGSRLDRLAPHLLPSLRQAHATALTIIEQQALGGRPQPWISNLRQADFGNDILTRAVTAFKGLGALATDEAAYAIAQYDDQGQRLHGARRYQLHLPEGTHLPAQAFWSVSLYASDRYFADNPIGRYALGDRSELALNGDGSLTLHIASEPPQDAPESNWLPAPAHDHFYLILRLYHPEQRFLDGEYAIPAVQQVLKNQRLLNDAD